jgi:hypothetical protein
MDVSVLAARCVDRRCRTRLPRPPKAHRDEAHDSDGNHDHKTEYEAVEQNPDEQGEDDREDANDKFGLIVPPSAAYVPMTRSVAIF